MLLWCKCMRCEGVDDVAATSRGPPLFQASLKQETTQTHLENISKFNSQKRIRKAKCVESATRDVLNPAWVRL